MTGITVGQVDSWYRSLDLPPTSKAHTYGLFRTILNGAWRLDLIESNPCRIEGAGNVKRATTTIVPTAAQVQLLADKMPSAKYRVMVLVAAWCGLRFGELTELRGKDIDVDDDGVPVVIRVRRAVTRVSGQCVVGTPKSDAGKRDVAIPPHIRGDLAEYLLQRRGGAEALLFPASRTGAHIAPSSLYKPFYRVRDDLGLGGLRWHDLRHFHGTAAAQSGATLAELKARLGHSTTVAAMRYQHAAEGRDAALAEAISGNVVPLKRGRKRA
jgi:integrase